jgi:uncharacterized membrane protein
MQLRCVGCHSAHPTIAGYTSAPLGIMFDTEVQIRSDVDRIVQYAVTTQFMPFGNITGMSAEERALIGTWFTEGTP